MRTPLGISLTNNNLYIASLITASVEVYHIGNGAPDISVTPASHDFGEVETGSSSVAVITVGNEGTADLAIDAVSSPSEPFSISADSCSGQSLAPAGTCTIEITFSPVDAVTYAGNFTIQSNDPDEGSVSVSLTGTGLSDSTAPVADFTASPTSGPAPLTVGFINNSSGVNLPLSNAWDFNNDGIIDSTDENPSVIYSDEGTYSVSLTVTDALGATSTLTRTDYITVSSDLYTLRVSVEGKGSVSSSPSGISCPGDCSEGYASGAGVVLTAAAEDNWRFSGWSGACSGTGSCVVTIDSDMEVTATFECTISFTDNLPGWAEDYILAVACEGIMDGYDDGTFMPNNNVTRADMAEFIINGLYGESFIYSSASFKYIQKMYEEGITTGCGGSNYCPDGTVNRAQMAVFIIRALYGEGFEHTGTPYFADVSSKHWAFGHVQRMKDDGITGGCSETKYCPAMAVTRAQMAVFLGRAFLGQ
jgi:PKD repeat protein